MAASRTLMALAIAATVMVELAMATNYTVGDSGGWELGSDSQSWASSKNFTAGDVIVFVYSANHDVLEVNEADFSSCSASNPIESHTSGNTAITLLTSGKRFFICGITGHCLSGMKVEIDTLAMSSPPPSSMVTPPAPPPRATPSSPPPASTPTSPPMVAPPPQVTPSSPPPTSSPTAPTSPPAKSPAKSPRAPSPGSNASPPAPPIKPTPPSPAPTPESPIPPFPFDNPMIPSAAPATPPPPPSSAYKCKVHFSVGFSFVVIMLLAL